MKTINAAIIGCGGIHEVHTTVLRELTGVKLAAVCDNKPERATRSAEKNGCVAYTDYRRMLREADIDTVHICTPHYLHAEMALEALRLGKRVLVEKPMATTVADARAMIAEDTRQGGGHLCVVFQNRYNAASRMLKETIESGRMGALKCLRGSVVWHRGPEYYADDWHGKAALECGGVMINQAIHTLDLVQWLGGGAESLKGAVSTDVLTNLIEVEDSAHFAIRMKNGVQAAVYATVGYGIDAPVEVEAELEKGRLLMRGESLFSVDDGYMRLCAPDGQPVGARDYWGSGHRAQVGDFYRCVAENRPFAIDGVQGIEAVKLVCGLYESSRTGQTVTL